MAVFSQAPQKRVQRQCVIIVCKCNVSDNVPEIHRRKRQFVDWILAYSHILYLILEVEDAVAEIDTRSKQRFNIRMLIHSGG